MKTSYILIFALSAGCLAAQNHSLTKADKYYYSRCYAKAIPLYEKGIEKDSSQATFLGKLGDCYRLTNNTKGEVSAYAKLVRSGNASPLQQLYFAEALTSE